MESPSSLGRSIVKCFLNVLACFETLACKQQIVIKSLGSFCASLNQSLVTESQLQASRSQSLLSTLQAAVAMVWPSRGERNFLVHAWCHSARLCHWQRQTPITLTLLHTNHSHTSSSAELIHGCALASARKDLCTGGYRSHNSLPPFHLPDE